MLSALIRPARARLVPPRLPTGADAPEGPLDADGIFLLLDGEVLGNDGTLRKAFQTKGKVSKTCAARKDLVSVGLRR